MGRGGGGSRDLPARRMCVQRDCGSHELARPQRRYLLDASGVLADIAEPRQIVDRPDLASDDAAASKYISGVFFPFFGTGCHNLSVTARAPRDLDSAGRALWRSVLAEYDLSPAETETLRQACRVSDLLARIDSELTGADVAVAGSMGQVRSHPLLQASADQRRVLDSLLRSLALPMPDEEEGRRVTPAARAVAQARWRGQRGALA